MTKNNQQKNIPVANKQLRSDYEKNKKLFEIQPVIVQRFLEGQARQIADAYIERTYTLHFTLPDRVIPSENRQALQVPDELREQRVGNFRDRISKLDVHATLKRRFTELEQSSEESVSLCSGILRYASASYMIHDLLPSGRQVKYLQSDEVIKDTIEANNYEFYEDGKMA